MSGKRKREEDDVTRSGRARKKPARFLDESIEEDVDKLSNDSDDSEEESPQTTKSGIKTPPIKSPPPPSKLLMQTLQAAPKPVIIQPVVQQQIKIQVPAPQLLQTVSVPQMTTVISPKGPLKVITQMAPQAQQQVVQHIVPLSPTTLTDNSEAGKRGRVRKKSAKVIEMEEFEEAEKTKTKKPGGKSPVVISPPVQQSPTKQLPPTGITIVRNEHGQSVVLSVAGGLSGMVKAEPSPPSAKKSKSRVKIKEPTEGSELLVKEEPSDLSSVAELSANIMAQAQGLQGATQKQKQIKSEPVTPKKQESPPSPSKKGKSVIKMLLNTPTQFTTPSVSTTAISSDKPKELDKSSDSLKSESNVVPAERPVKKIIMSPSDLDDGHQSYDDDEDDEDFDDELDEDDEGDDEDDMEWQFESQDGTLLEQEELARKAKDLIDASPIDNKKGKKKTSKKKQSLEEDDFDDDDFGDDDDDDEGNLVIADEVNKKKKTTKKAPSKKKGDTKAGGKTEKPVKEKKKKRLTAYTMWCNSMRNKVLTESPGIDFAQLSRRLGEIWQGLPSRDKMSWKRKAKKEARKLMGKGQLISTGKVATSTPAASGTVQQKISHAPKSVPAIHHPTASQQKALAAAAKQEDHAIQLRGSGIEPIDVAAYLKLVGESLSIIGMRLQEHRGLIAVQGSLSVLLDSLLCALGPLMCLTTQIPELHGCPAETHSRTLDNLAYFMPGL
ncbi:HMG box-containing protein 4-like [Mytilus californianus]|uniref:HMG box-containing protein 4-like n=1 Tax=Mytilus californianus TaxID=6549 RepID=UPI0022472032|nr:HMG box-containing protein 4-like [Mytilus californianus]